MRAAYQRRRKKTVGELDVISWCGTNWANKHNDETWLAGNTLKKIRQ